MALSRKMHVAATMWVLAGALLLHLTAPLVYVTCISRVKQMQRVLLASAKGHNEETLIYLSAAAFDKHFDTPERELEIAGLRYDVDRYTRKGNMVVCRVLKDDHEQRLINGMKRDAAGCNKATVSKFPLWQVGYWEKPLAFKALCSFPTPAAFWLPSNESVPLTTAESYVSPPPDGQSCCVLLYRALPDA